MTKDELKFTALESMSQAGAAMEQGDCQQALNLAEKAWNCYYELQRQRSEDEDFSDLIYCARDMYCKIQHALEEQRAEEHGDDENADIEISIEALEEYLDLQISNLKEAKENNPPDSQAVYNASYDLLFSQVMLAEKRKAQACDCWKNTQLVRDFIPVMKTMMHSKHLDQVARENMFDLSSRIFECIDNTLGSTWVLSSPRLKKELDTLVLEIAMTLPDKDCSVYQEAIEALEYFISAADNGQLEEVVNEYEGIVYDPIELTAQYEQLLPEADRRGEAAYRSKGEGATLHDFYNAKRLCLAAMGVDWTPPTEALPDDSQFEAYT